MFAQQAAYQGPGPRSHLPRRRGLRLGPAQRIWAACLALCALLLLGYGWHTWHAASRASRGADDADDADDPHGMLPPYHAGPLLVSYAYYEKDPIQRANLEFFLQAGWVAPPAAPEAVTWVFSIAGGRCGPCGGAFPLSTPLDPDPAIGVTRAIRVERGKDEADPVSRGLVGGYGPAAAGGVTLALWREENVGMDLASHNASLEYVARHVAGGLRRYRVIFLLNSSVRGPLAPAWLPPAWHWSHAFLERFRDTGGGTGGTGGTGGGGRAVPRLVPEPPGRPHGPAAVRAVGASLVCLPAADAGGPGPRLESWALALDHVALGLLLDKGVFKVRTCKTCTDAEQGIVVGGEYGITAALLEAGHNVATLMSKYARGVDWRDVRHWGCNDNVHPSRHGTYDGIAFHPFETIFVKSSWHVADPYTRRYGTWVTQHLEGDPGTDGEWNEELYRYAISLEAQKPNLLEAAYNVTRVRQLLAKQRDAEAAALEEELRAAGERAIAHEAA